MKHFQRLLVAPAALGLLVPMTATNATEFNLKDVSSYSSNSEVESISNFSNIQPSDWAFQAITDVASSRGCSAAIPSGSISRFEAAAILNSCLSNVAQVTDQETKLLNEFASELATLKGRVDGLEVRFNEFEAGSFSETTAASFSADFLVGSVDGSTDSETLTAGYGYQIDLSTSFTGEDSFFVSLDAGNGGGATLAEADLNSGGDGLTVDGIGYQFPVGDKMQVVVGDSIDGSSLYSTACVYGGFTNTLDDCGNASSAFTTTGDSSIGFSASYDIGSGLTGAIGYVGDGANTEGLMSKAGTDMYGGQLTYTADSYGVSVTYATVEDGTKTSSSVLQEYLDDTTYWGLNAYWTPEETGFVPSVSVGFETGDKKADTADTEQWFLGFQWDEAGPGTLGAAIGSAGAIAEGGADLVMYEAFYSYPLNDGMTITPAVYFQETAAGTDDITGVMVKTSFSF